jgi:sugar/nucleoside kinase (ribokinase family)
MTERLGQSRSATVAGHLCLDLTPAFAGAMPPPGGLAQAGPLGLRLGGCVANTARALAALGADVRAAAVVGDDLLGDAAAALLAAAPFRHASVRRAAIASTSYSVVLEPPGEDRRFLHHVGANAAFDADDAPIDGADILHVGYPQLLPRLLHDRGAGLSALLARAQAAGVVTSVDFATTDPRDAARYPWHEVVHRWAPLADVLSPSADDLWPAFGHRDPVALADALVRAGVAVALVTAGRDGMWLRTASSPRLRGGGKLLAALSDEWADRQLYAPASRLPAIRTAGAGDAATAGLLFALLAGLDPTVALRLVADVAASHVSGIEPLPPWRPRSAYSSVPMEEVDVDGWRADKLGLLHGPAD